MPVESALTEGELARRIAAMVRDRFPATWKVKESFDGIRDKGRPDLEIRIQAPDGQRVRLVFEIKRNIERRDIDAIARKVRTFARSAEAVPVVAAQYLPPSVRDALAEEGLSYADATGNVRVVADAPALFIADRGQDRDPWRQGRPRGTLKGDPAARVARALLDFDRAWRVRELIATSGASNGATYRVLEYLQREDLVSKDTDRYVVTDWERLLRQWSSEAPFTSAAHSASFIEPRGVAYFLNKVAKGAPFPVAVTGSFAASEWATYAPAKAAYVYVPSIEDAAARWGLRPNEVAPNVVLLEPGVVDAFQFENAVPSREGYPIAALAQVAADLLNGPGREPAEGEYLIAWMKDNESKWRRA